MQTDREWAFELFVMDHKGQVFRLHSPSRHVPRLGGHMPFCIIPPRPILAAGGVWNNSGLHGSYIGVAMLGADSRDPRLSGKTSGLRRAIARPALGPTPSAIRSRAAAAATGSPR
jgi:hypothetical protein